MTYATLSSTHLCGHIKGGFPARCYQNDDQIRSQYTCKSLCTAAEWCTGYSYGAHCNLFTSSDSCSGKWLHEDGPIAKSAKDFSVSTTSGYNCYVKLEG